MRISGIPQLEEFINSKQEFVLKCGASWCTPCHNIGFRNIKPHYNAQFAEIDVDAVEGSGEILKHKFGLTSIPYFMVWKDGKEIPLGIQTNDESQLDSFLSRHLERKPLEGRPQPDAGSAKVETDDAIVKYLEDTLSAACENIRNAHSIDFDETQALNILQQCLRNRDVKNKAKKADPAKHDYPSKVQHIKSSMHWKEMIEETKSGKPLVVDCWMEKCAPCKRIGPKYEIMAEEYSDATFAKANITNKDILSFGQEQGLKKIPFFMVYKNGMLLEETLQHSDENLVREFILRSLDSPPPKAPEPISAPQEVGEPEKTLNDFEDDFAMDDDF